MKGTETTPCDSTICKRNIEEVSDEEKNKQKVTKKQKKIKEKEKMNSIKNEMVESKDILQLAEQWLEWDKNEKDRKTIKTLLDAQNYSELDSRLSIRIPFRTAGLRAKMKAGFSFMNDLVVIQTSQGLCKYLEAHVKDVQQRGVIIGYDHRYNSKTFANFVASVFLSQGIKVYLFSTIVATPILAFGVLHKQAAAGVMVTASHNPKDDNGYKVYWGNGSQIISPHDQGITKSILANLQPWPTVSQQVSYTSPLLEDPLEDITHHYFHQISKDLCWTRTANSKSKIKIVYTPVHGVGHAFTSRAFKVFDLPPYIPTPEHIKPDPEFPTVKFPNPEEGKGTLALAIAAAERAGSHIIIANDPDADRLALAEKVGDDWKIFNGNELGILLASWIWMKTKERLTAEGKSFQADQYAMVTTVVSSKMMRAMAIHEGFQFHETLTGFKWIGNKFADLKKQGITPLFGFEEAIGFMAGDTCLDKDGVRTAAVLAELIIWLANKNQGPNDHLNSLYQQYGYCYIKTRYVYCYDPSKMSKILERIRTGGKEGSYFHQCGKYNIKHIRDQELGYDSSQKDFKSRLPSKEKMMNFTLEDGSLFTLRLSGTEPKLKYYVEVFGSKGETRDSVRARHADITDAIMEHFLQPKNNNLVVPSKL